MAYLRNRDRIGIDGISWFKEEDGAVDKTGKCGRYNIMEGLIPGENLEFSGRQWGVIKVV